MATYLVTGIAGFIGSTLARALLARGEKVIGFDNFSTGKRDNLAEVLHRIDLHEADLLDLDALHRACRGVDYVLHGAAIPSVPRSVKDPLGNNRANVDGTLNLLVAARDAKVEAGDLCRLLFRLWRYSHLAQAGRHAAQPDFSLRHRQAGRRILHDVLLSLLRPGDGLSAVLQRLRSASGPLSPYSGVLAKFITQMLKGEAPTIFGDGSQSRDFTFVDNVVAANLLACKAEGAEAAGKVFNVATGHRTDLNQTCEILKKLTGYSGEVKHGPERAGDVKHSLADISRAQKHLGYQPRGDFEEGLSRTIAWYRQPEMEPQSAGNVSG